MPKKKALELTDEERAKRIKEMAREVEADEVPYALSAVGRQPFRIGAKAFSKSSKVAPRSSRLPLTKKVCVTVSRTLWRHGRV